jgi:hypothetical protein
VADVWEAYKFLNESLKLDLSPDQMAKVESDYKAKWMQDQQFPAEIGGKSLRQIATDSDWEFFLHLVPTKRSKTS